MNTRTIEKDVTLLGDVVDYNAPPKSAKVAAFVLPNAYIDPNTPLSNFAVPLESLEAVSGLTFFPKATNDLQTRDDIDRSERQFIQGRLGDALKQNSNNNKNTTKRLGGLSDEEHIKILLTDSTSSKERRESGFRESREKSRTSREETTRESDTPVRRGHRMRFAASLVTPGEVKK